MKIAIVTDSSCDLPEDLLYQYNIREVSFKVIVNNSVRDDNRIEFDRDEYYQKTLNGKAELKVEPPSVDDFIQVYKKIAHSYDAVISIHQSARFSNAVKNARAAAVQGSETYRKIRAQNRVGTVMQIRIIDSKSTSIGLGLLVLRAAELVYDDINFTKFCNELETLAEQIFFYLVPAEWSRLQKALSAAKVSPIEASLAKALDQRLILRYNRSEIARLDKVKGHQTALKEMSAMALGRLQEKNSYDKIGIVYGGALSELETVSAMNDFRVEVAVSGLGSLVSQLNPSDGFYSGAKSVGIAIITGDINARQLIGR